MDLLLENFKIAVLFTLVGAMVGLPYLDREHLNKMRRGLRFHR
jgi:hypothetical protein